MPRNKGHRGIHPSVAYLVTPVKYITEVLGVLKEYGWLRRRNNYVHKVDSEKNSPKYIELGDVAVATLAAARQLSSTPAPVWEQAGVDVGGKGVPKMLWTLLADDTLRFIPAQAELSTYSADIGLPEHKLPPPAFFPGAALDGAMTPEVEFHFPDEYMPEIAPPAAAAADMGPVCPGLDAFRYVELFAGVGGFRVALDALGGECVMSSEIHPFACDVYEHNFGECCEGDVRDVDAAAVPEHDLLTAGFPCQPFSNGGDQPALKDARGHLFWQVLRIIRASKPSALLLENVPGLVTCEDGNMLKTIMRELTAAGYTVGYVVLNARMYVPQKRRRIYIVGHRTELVEREGTGVAWDGLVSIKRIVKEVLGEVTAEEKALLTLSDHKMSQQGPNSFLRTDPERCLTGVAGTLTHSYRAQRPGFANASNTLFVPQEGENPRQFTARECARLQGFPETFHLEGKPGTRGGSFHQCAGNAVSPPIVAAVAARVLCGLQHGGVCSLSGAHAALSLAAASTGRPSVVLSTPVLVLRQAGLPPAPWQGMSVAAVLEATKAQAREGTPKVPYEDYVAVAPRREWPPSSEASCTPCAMQQFETVSCWFEGLTVSLTW